MSTGLLSLGPELITCITRILQLSTKQNVERAEKDIFNFNPQEHDEEGGSSEHRVSTGLKTLINLSSTCTRFRAVLAPVVYQKLWLTNTITSAASVKAVADGNLRGHVREILFIGRAPGSEENGFDDVVNVIPSEVLEVLVDLRSHFPNLNSLNIGFAFEAWNYDKWANFLSESFINSESDEEVEYLETKEVFRALIAGVWDAISRNQTGIIKNLTMRHFFPKLVKTYFSEPFQKFLGDIEKFEISMWGQYDGVGPISGAGDGYFDAISKLHNMFAGLRSCTDFTLKASRYDWIGCGGMGHGSLPLKPGMVPKLERLTLQHCFPGPELCDLLRAHSGTLRVLIMQDCCAITGGVTDDGTQWHELFRSMMFLEELEQVEVSPKVVAYSWHMQYSDTKHDENDLEDIANVAMKLEMDSSKRVFPYGEMVDKYSDWSPRPDKVRESFWKGHDQREWNNLNEILHRRQNRRFPK